MQVSTKGKIDYYIIFFIKGGIALRYENTNSYYLCYITNDDSPGYIFFIYYMKK